MRRFGLRFSVLLAIFLAAVAGGYFVSSAFGQEVLRQELEEQLSRLMQSPVEIESARLVIGIDGGFRLEGREVSTYRDAEGPQLSVRRAVARLDVASLTLGRLNLQRLFLEGAHLRTVRNRGGRWTPLPIGRITRPSGETGQDLERRVRSLRAFETVARFFLERGLLASSLELEDGSITVIDEGVSAGEDPLQFDLRDIRGKLVRSWMSEETELSLRAYLVGAEGRGSAIDATGRRGGDGAIRLSLSTRDLALQHFLPYAEAAVPGARLGGTVTGVVSVESQVRDHGRIELDWVVRDLSMSVRLREDPIPVESPHLRLRALLELHPGRLRLAHAEIATGEIKMAASGVMERPVRDSSNASVTASLRGAGLPQLEAFVSALPKADSEALGRLVERVVSGEIVRIGGEGSARLGIWRSLIEGDLTRLPERFVLSAEVRDVVVGTSEIDELTDLDAHVEWRGDRIELHQAHALWNGRPLPGLSASIDGFSHLLGAPPEARELRVEASRLPGLRTAWQLFASDSSEGSKLPEVWFSVEELHHTAIRWPVRDALLSVEEIENGIRLVIEEALWAGAPASGEGIWLREPEPRMHLDVRVTAPSEEPSKPIAAEAPDAWISGRFGFDGSADARVPYVRLAGDFAVVRSGLQVNDVRGSLLPSGRFQAGGFIDLSDAETLPLEIRLEIVDGDVAELTEAVGFPSDFAQGKTDVAGFLSGEARRGEPLLSNLEGRIEVSAGPGQVHRSLPVITAVANTSEGLVTEAEVRYEQIETAIDFDRGKLSTDRFALDGPMRLLAEGSFDPGEDEEALDITVGIFLMRRFDQMLGSLPLIKHFTDSDKGLFGLYFQLTGTWNDPVVDTLEAKTLAEGTGLIRVVEAPLKMLRELESIFGGSGRATGPRSSPSPLGRKGGRRKPRQPEKDAVEGASPVVDEPAATP